MNNVQLTFNFLKKQTVGRDNFFISPSNEDAFQAINNWQDWSAKKLGIIGPTSSGKSHLVSLWSQEVDARIISIDDLLNRNIVDLSLNRFLALENVHEINGLKGNVRSQSEISLLHLFNAMSENHCYFLITGVNPPSMWNIGLADLSSRLATLPLVYLLRPSDTMLSALIVKQFEDRQIVVSPELVGFVLKRIERSFQAVSNFVECIDRLTFTEKREITIPIARKILRKLGH